MSETSGEVVFEEYRTTMDVLTGISTTFPPSVTLAVVARICEIVAGAQLPPDAETPIRRSVEVIVAVGKALSAMRRPEPPKGWSAITEWWARSLCMSLFTPVLLAVIEGHLRTAEAGKTDGTDGTNAEAEAAAGAVAKHIVDSVLVPQAQAVFT